MAINRPNVISIESSYRAEYKNIFCKIFWLFCKKLQKVEISGVGGPRPPKRRPEARHARAEGPSFQPIYNTEQWSKAGQSLLARAEGPSFNPSKRLRNSRRQGEEMASPFGEGRRPELSTRLKGWTIVKRRANLPARAEGPSFNPSKRQSNGQRQGKLYRRGPKARSNARAEDPKQRSGRRPELQPF